jgi:hypothetical protein
VAVTTISETLVEFFATVVVDPEVAVWAWAAAPISSGAAAPAANSACMRQERFVVIAAPSGLGLIELFVLSGRRAVKAL